MPEGKPKSRWSWKQFIIAIAMLPTSAVMWFWGLDTAFDPRPDGIRGLCLVVSPVVATVGAIWILVLVIRWFWPRKRFEVTSSNPATNS
jgi:hypothetical protein